MKRLASILLLISLTTGCTALGSTEGAPPVPVVLYVDNQRVGEFPAGEAEAVLRAAGLLDVEVVREGNEIRAYKRPALPREPKIESLTPGFDVRIRAAMQLLKDKSPERYAALTKNAELIVMGAKNSAYPSNNTIAISTVDVEKGTVTWIAGSLAHEAEHLRVYHEDGNLRDNRLENERNSYRVSLEVLRAVGAAQREIDWTLKALESPPTD